MNKPRERIWCRKTDERVAFKNRPLLAERKLWRPIVVECLSILVSCNPMCAEEQWMRIKLDPFPEAFHQIIFKGENTTYDFKTKILKIQASTLLKWLYEKRYTDYNLYSIKDVRSVWNGLENKLDVIEDCA
jgi:hypothetical protein